jgi:hypothetical protein
MNPYLLVRRGAVWSLVVQARSMPVVVEYRLMAAPLAPLSPPFNPRQNRQKPPGAILAADAAIQFYFADA